MWLYQVLWLMQQTKMFKKNYKNTTENEKKTTTENETKTKVDA